MKNIILVLILAFTSVAGYAANVLSLSGRVTDKKTGEPLVGATILVPDLKTGATTDLDGHYKIDNLPQRKILFQVSLAGYKTVVETVDLGRTATKDFELEDAVTELNEVVVTGLSRATEQKRTPTPISVVPALQLLQANSTNIIDAIAKQPGIAQITTGAGISKPVIRGLGYNRVVVVDAGIRQEGQQWGDEHGIEVDGNGVNRVEILKGPASLAYGSDAMAGVINLLPAPPPSDGRIAGTASANYQTNNGLFGYSADLAGNRHGLIWDLRYSNKLAHAYQNKFDGYVFNSGFRENALNAMIGLNKTWGYSHLTLSAYHLKPGIIEGARDSASGQFVKPVLLPDGSEGSDIAADSDFKSYQPAVPFQQIHHYKAVWSSSLILGNGDLKTTLAFQQNQRQEYGDVQAPDEYGLYFLLHTIPYDVQYHLPEIGRFNVSVGVNGMQQSSKNKGSEFLVPAYNLFDFGVFSIVKRSFDKLDFSGGLRFDTRSQHGFELYLDADGWPLNGPAPGATQQFAGFHSGFSGVSGSLGAAWQISGDWYAKFNISRGYRAPNIAELGSNGVHEGTLRYETGDPDLKPENSLQLDYAIGLNTEHVSAELDLFDNTIRHFIFLRKLESAMGGDSLTEDYSTFRFVSAGKAHLFGGEARIDLHPHPLDWLHFENTFSYVQAVQRGEPDSTRYLPYTPAPRWQSTLKADFRKIGPLLRNAYVKLELEYLFRQNHFYRAYGTETATPAYALLNFGLGADLARDGKTLCSLYFNIENLTDRAYQSHLSRLKYGDVNNVSGRTGVYNMGRNVSVKVVVPVGGR